MAQRGGLQPHRVRYWLNPVIEDEEAFAADIRQIIGLYESARELAEARVRVVSCDEKTGMQALERWGKSQAMRPGQPERMESMYRRHGTLCLIANLDIATGRVVAPSIGPTRGNDDFLRHIKATVQTDPTARWVFIVDNLNTHTSPGLVRWVAEQNRFEGDLGVAFKRGHLHTQKTRRAFLSRPEHNVRFVYTPKHCSWLNEVERWFSKLARAVLRRGSFTSTAELQRRVMDYIRYANVVDARPHKWTAKADDILRKLKIKTSDGMN